MTDIKLYWVNSTIEEFAGCKDVNFSWLVARRPWPVVPYTKVIEGCTSDISPRSAANTGEPWGEEEYAKAAVDELFTLEEAEMLKAYLKEAYGDESARITEVELPITDNRIGLGFIPVGGPQGFYMLDQTDGYSLPFKVWGYYDLSMHWDEEDLEAPAPIVGLPEPDAGGVCEFDDDEFPF